MTLSQMLLGELEHESATTRKFLERVPEDKGDWRPHPKSMPLGRLAGHVAEMTKWGRRVIDRESMDITAPEGPRNNRTVMESRKQLLEVFETSLADMKEVLASASDETLMKPWTLIIAGKTIWTLPRLAVLRNMVFNHTVHHRAQLGVYLRMNDIPVPASYGGTADESIG